MVLGISAIAAAEDDPVYGPRFEGGGGFGYLADSSRPNWGSQSFYQVLFSGSVRVYRGFSLTGGFDYGLGEKPPLKNATLGEYQVPINKKSPRTAVSAGVRYEHPAWKQLKDLTGAYSIYGAAGMTWADYEISSTKWSSELEKNTELAKRTFAVADLSGPYAALALRWRIDNPDPALAGTWANAYGVDFGVRYTRYSEHTMKDPFFEKPSSSFSGSQIFLIGFIKFDPFD